MPTVSNLPIQDGTYRAQVGERTFDLRFEEGTLFLDDTPVSYAFEPLSDSYFALRLNGRSIPIVVEVQPNGTLRVTAQGRRAEVQVKDEQALLLERFGMASGASAAEREVRAPMPGLVLSVQVEAGQAVKNGDALLVLEAMKMENELRAPNDVVVASVHVKPGDAVGKNELLVAFE